MNFLEVRWAD